MTEHAADKTPLILIVDDDWMNREMMETQLSYASYRVALAHSGRQALEMIASQLPDLILLDVRLQDLSGFEVCRRIKTDPRFAAVPVLMLTALKTAADKHLAREAGADDILTKPFIASMLIERIEKLTEGKPHA
ncbi:MAG: response regulator [Anaerolineae bacterium]|nr:response regulator [Anaerolineae bacterium]